MNRDEFRTALFDVIECLTNHPLLESGKKVVLHYFNESKEQTALERAVWAINKYYPESFPEKSEWSKRFSRLMDRLQKEADIWDAD